MHSQPKNMRPGPVSRPGIFLRSAEVFVRYAWPENRTKRNLRPLATGLFALESIAMQIEAASSGRRPWYLTADFRQTMTLGTRLHASIIWRSKSYVLRGRVGIFGGSALFGFSPKSSETPSKISHASRVTAARALRNTQVKASFQSGGGCSRPQN